MKRLQVLWKLEPDVFVSSDPLQLGIVVRNILENAVTYSDEGGAVEIQTNLNEDRAHIRVSNTGSRISQDQADQAFERFWRGDTARTDVGDRCGLGLSLVKNIAAILGGSVSVESSTGSEFQITVSLPN